MTSLVLQTTRYLDTSRAVVYSNVQSGIPGQDDTYLVDSIKLTNVSPRRDSVLVNLWHVAHGISKRILPVDLIFLYGSHLILDEKITIAPGDSIEGMCSDPNAVELIIEATEQ
jgi:hypothetical protein